MYHWDVLVTYHWKVIGYFIWDLLEMSWRYTDLTSLLRSLETLSWRSNKTLWRRATETSWWVLPRRHWVFHLRCTCDVAGTYRETLLQPLHGVLLLGGLLKMLLYLIILILWPVLNLEALGFVSAFQTKLSNHH